MEERCTYMTCTVRIPNCAVAKIDERVRNGYAINRADYIRRVLYSDLKAS